MRNEAFIVNMCLEGGAFRLQLWNTSLIKPLSIFLIHGSQQNITKIVLQVSPTTGIICFITVQI